jgi:hypothetical protein
LDLALRIFLTHRLVLVDFEPTFRKPHGIFMNQMPHRGAPGVAAVVGADRSP